MWFVAELSDYYEVFAEAGYFFSEIWIKSGIMLLFNQCGLFGVFSMNSL